MSQPTLTSFMSEGTACDTLPEFVFRRADSENPALSVVLAGVWVINAWKLFVELTSNIGESCRVNMFVCSAMVGWRRMQ